MNVIRLSLFLGFLFVGGLFAQNANRFGDRMAQLKQLDTNKDGVINKVELEKASPEMLNRFTRLDANSDGKLDTAELERQPNARRSPRGGRQAGGAGRAAGGGGRGRLPDTSPAVGAMAPDFILPYLNAKTNAAPFTLSKAVGKKPVLLVFGSYTCPPFRDALMDMEGVYQEFGKDIEAVFIYIREAHAADERPVGRNEQLGISPTQPKTFTERQAIATQCQKGLDLSMPIIVDSLDNKTDALYFAKPNRAYVLGLDGKIVFKGPYGPQGTPLKGVRDALQGLLKE